MSDTVSATALGEREVLGGPASTQRSYNDNDKFVIVFFIEVSIYLSCVETNQFWQVHLLLLFYNINNFVLKSSL